MTFVEAGRLYEDGYSSVRVRYYDLPILLAMNGDTPILFHNARRLRVMITDAPHEYLLVQWFSNS